MHSQWLHTMDEMGQTPLDRAFASGHMALAELMLRTEKDDLASRNTAPPMHRAAQLGLTEAVRSLLSFGSNPTERDESGETPLHKAAREGHADCVALLAPVSDVNTSSEQGLAPLHWACLSGRADIAGLLLAQGADPALCSLSADGLSAMGIARALGFSEVEAALHMRPAYV